MAYFRFFVELGAEGDTAEEAWDAAIEYFVLDPGEPSRTERFDSLDAMLDGGIKNVRRCTNLGI